MKFLDIYLENNKTMKTAEEIINDLENRQMIQTSFIGEKTLIKVIKEYTRQVAIEVRKECANKATTACDKIHLNVIDVDEDSILNVDIEQFIK